MKPESNERKRLTSLLLVEERLLEAAYFAERVRHLASPEIFFELNAFLSAARSVTWLVQKEFAHVPGFKEWWKERQSAMSSDADMGFFLKLRNFSQKEGRVYLVGSGSRDPSGILRVTYRFAGNEARVPPGLLNRNVSDCCIEHVGKLGDVVLQCVDRFPFYACPKRAITAEGLEALGLTVGDLDEIVGLPRGWIAAGPIPDEEALRILREQVDGLDYESLATVAAMKSLPASEHDDGLGTRLATALVNLIEKRSAQDER